MLGTASSGAPVTCARVFAVSTPTRRPVNSPGPIPTANPPTWPRSVPVQASSCSSGGRHALLARLARDLDPPEDRRLGADRDRDLGVAVSIPTTITPTTAPRARGDRVAALGPGGAGRLDRDAPRLVGAGRVAPDELDAEPVFGEQTRDRVAPLDEQDALAVLELVERQVDHVLLALEPVQVDVRERHTAGHVLAHERERRRGHVLGRAEPARRPPGRTSSCPRRARR